MAHMQTKVVELISKQPHLRSDQRIKMVLPWLRKKSHLFEEMDKAVLIDVIRNCDYKKCTSDDIIIQQGQQGDSFYIMLTGRTSVFIDTRRTDVDEEGEQQGSMIMDVNPDSDPEGSDLETLEAESSGGRPKKPIDRNKFGKFIMHYESGKSFGEVALMSEDSVRNATIIADEDTDLLVISRDLFNRSVKAKQEEEYEERKEFVDNNPYFRNWSLKFRRLLELSIRKEVLPAGSVLLKQGESVMGLVFILSGQAKVTMQPSRYPQQFPLLIKQDVNPVAREIGRNYNQVEEKADHTFRQSQVHVRRSAGYAAAEKRIMGRTVDVCCIEANDLLGDIEMALELDTNLFTVTCTETTTVMILDTKNYDRLIAKRHQTTINSLCYSAYQKLKFRMQNENTKKVKLLSILFKKLQDKIIVKPHIAEKMVDKEKSEFLKILVDMFLKGKVPLIEPFVPDSLVYRRKSERRAKMIEIQNRKNHDLSEKVEDRLYGSRRKIRVARSMKQLRNVKTENELLKTSETVTELAPRASTTSIRPRTAIGFHRELTSVSSTNGRPQTAGIFHLTESSCKADDGSMLPVISTEEIGADVEDIIERLDYVQRGKSEVRSRVICSATAVSDIKQNIRSGGYSNSSIDDPFDEDYFDWETSEKNLDSLENRIRQFCTHESGNKRPVTVSSLRRFCIKDERNEETLELNVPKPGGTVFVKAKPCQQKLSNKEVEGHAHVRRYIVNREEVDFASANRRRPKSASPTILRQNSSSSLRVGGQRPRTSVMRQ